MESEPLATFIRDLKIVLSEQRLNSYRSDPGTNLEMLVNYFWNIDLAEALVPCLHAAEVSLRNSIHSALTARYNNEMWFYEQDLLEPAQLSQFAIALRNVSGKPLPISGRIVAELPFSFWVTLLSGPYEQRIWRLDRFALFHTVFPHASGLSRNQIHRRFNRIRLLRNRVMHYEPLWNQRKWDLARSHQEIHEAIRWMSPTLGNAILAVDDFQHIFNGKGQVEADLKLHLGIS